jgi:hypothetical protein
MLSNSVQDLFPHQLRTRAGRTMIFEGHACRLGETIYPLEKMPVEIVVFHGRTLHLHTRRPMDDAMRDALDQTPKAMLMYEDGRKFRAQRGLIFDTGEEDILGFISADRFVDGNRREYSRAPLPIQVTVRTLDAHGGEVSSWQGQCTDISAGGIKIADRGSLVPAALTQIELRLGPENVVQVPGALAWRNERWSALTIGCAEESRNQIGSLVARWHRERVRAENQVPAAALLG